MDCKPGEAMESRRIAEGVRVLGTLDKGFRRRTVLKSEGVKVPEHGQHCYMSVSRQGHYLTILSGLVWC